MSSIYSESWYRIANQRVVLRNQVHMRRQVYRGEKWYVLEDPFTNQFFRIRPEAREFLVRLRPDRTVEEVWKECLDLDPEHAPGQEDVIRLLAQLYHGNLLQYGLPEDSIKLFERYKKRRAKEIRSKLLSIMFMRIPLLDPDDFLKRTLPSIGRLISWPGAAIWALAVIFALKVVIDHFSLLVDQSQGILAPSNLFLLYVAMVFIKTLHEFGHAYACRKFGGEVHVMGVMLLIFTPVPYMDATSSWAFRSRWQRALVGAAGMIVEVFLAALAALVWANTGPGTINSLAYNVIFIASVSTILFNINPLLRFDGYYILSDLLEIPSLHTRSTRQLRHLCEYHLFGYTKSTSPARSSRESALLTSFGILSGIYKIFVFTAIILFVADKFLLAGLIMALICIFSLGVVPLIRFARYLAHSPQLERTRIRAVAVVVGLALFIVLFFQFVPFRHYFRAPGILKAEPYAELSSQSEGTLAEIVTPGGNPVRAGDVLLRLDNPEVDYLVAMVDAEWEEAQARYQRAMRNASADLEPLAAYREAIRQRRERLIQRKEELLVRSPVAGLWVSPEIEDWQGRWIARGYVLGKLTGTDEFRFSAVIPQSQASRLFDGRIRSSGVRLRGQSGKTVEVTDFRVIPAEQRVLPSAALGWLAGGDIEVSPNDAMGRTAAEPFFEVIASLKKDEAISFFHGQSGVIRFRLPGEPLLPRWVRAFRQLLQKRYQF
jgi:putative peptide zinc metalloprotease protein